MRVCYLCQHFSFDAGQRGYSEFTPGEDVSFDCRKRHWSFRVEGGFRDVGGSFLGFAETMETAVGCPDFLPETEIEA